MTTADLRRALLKPWRHGDHFDGRGATVDAALDLSGCRLRGFDLSSARFAAGLDARGAEFQGLAWFQAARFAGAVNLTGATCRFDLCFDGVQCPTLDLTGLRMEGVLRLDGARVDRLVLADAVLLANLSLSRACVRQIEATNLEVMGGLWAPEARIDPASFAHAHIEGRV